MFVVALASRPITASDIAFFRLSGNVLLSFFSKTIDWSAASFASA